jgi:hypothetical protein
VVILVFAAELDEARDFAASRDFDGEVRCLCDVSVALTGFWIHAGDEVYLLPSTAPAVVRIVERQAGGLDPRPQIHRPYL